MGLGLTPLVGIGPALRLSIGLCIWPGLGLIAWLRIMARVRAMAKVSLLSPSGKGGLGTEKKRDPSDELWGAGGRDVSPRCPFWKISHRYAPKVNRHLLSYSDHVQRLGAVNFFCAHLPVPPYHGFSGPVDPPCGKL